MLKLQKLSNLPADFFQWEATDLRSKLGNPTLIELAGGARPPLFVSVLLHGNEVTGWLAVQKWLKSEALSRLPRPVLLFIGNVFAAELGQRRLENQPDYNRIWRSNEAAAEASLHARPSI